jgi:hypothetical protein
LLGGFRINAYLCSVKIKGADERSRQQAAFFMPTIKEITHTAPGVVADNAHKGLALLSLDSP